MSYNFERDNLLPRARELASKKYPNGFTKRQLIECADEIKNNLVGNFAIGITKIKTDDDIRHAKNYLSEIDGHYPRGVSDCFAIGINGDCSIDCPVFRRGECDGELTEFVEELNEECDDEEINKIKDLYATHETFVSKLRITKTE